MSRYYSHVKTATEILQLYNAREPFGYFLKDYFRLEKKHGSTDRKNITQLCYAYFRLGKALQQLSADIRVLTGFFLCSDSSNEVLKNLKPEWNEMANLPLKEKYSMISDQFSIDSVFPWKEQLHESIDHLKFSESFFIQPDLFIRLRPDHELIVQKKLAAAGISYKEISPGCLALPNASKTDAVLQIDKEAVIQDYNSQRVGEIMKLANLNRESAIGSRQPAMKVWDCCAGSGGKSILAYDIFPNIELTVSDIRSSIIENLHERFTRAGIKAYTAFDTDLTHNSRLPIHDCRLIIADVPCTGSGTWSRTPEQLFYFDPSAIEKYSTLQKKIVGNIIPHLAPGGHLLYCTCSVFKEENEEMVQLIQEKYNLQLKKMEYLEGYERKADTLFAALFTA